MSFAKKVTDYLLLRTPEPRMGGKGKKKAAPGKISGARIAFSFIGIILGIVLSFFITGLSGSASDKPAGHSPAADATTRLASPASSPETEKPSIEPKVSDDLSWRRFLKVGLISLVICCLSYQGLYNSLRLYENEPAWLILFISFQYGYFWQSVVKVVAG